VLQLDQLVGLAMLVAASVVFLYYTIWTLLMVRIRLLPSASEHEANDSNLAICRLGSCPTEPIPSASLGNQNSRYSHTIGFCCGGIVFKCGYDSKQQEAGREGQSCYEEEGIRGWHTGALENWIEEKEESKIYMVALKSSTMYNLRAIRRIRTALGDLFKIGRACVFINMPNIIYRFYGVWFQAIMQGDANLQPSAMWSFPPHLRMCWKP
jgi:hypothetical protein